MHYVFIKVNFCYKLQLVIFFSKNVLKSRLMQGRLTVGVWGWGSGGATLTEQQ